MTSKIELSKRESREYDLASAILVLADTYERPEARDGLVFEISAELARNAPMDHGGLFVPYNMSARAGLDTATSTKGPELKFTEGYTFFDALRNYTAVIKAGATVLSGLKGDALIPKLETDTGAVWTPQNPGSDISDTTPTFGNVGLTPHELVGTTSYSRQLLAQSVNSADVDTLVRGDLARVHGVAIDAAALNGSGSSGQPTGILNRGDLSAQLLAFGTNGLIPTWPLIAQMELLASVQNGNVNPETSAYIVTPEIRYRFRTTDRTSGTSGWFIMVDDNDINEYPVIATNQLPKNLTKGTSNGVCHAIVFGDFSQMLIGMWAGFEIIADPFRLKKQGMVEVTTYQLADTSVRHIKAFAVSKDALP